MKTIGTILGSLAIGKLVKDSTQVAMSVETAVENINHNMGQAAKTFQDWVDTQSKSLGMAKSDAYNYGSIFSNLLSSFTSNAQETADQTQELMKASAIIASRTGRTYDDVSNRIRSGMLGSTEAIEDLGVYTNISMIESTEAFRRFAGDKSWAQLDFQTQQQIRLAAILEQTYARYGDTLADTTQTRQAQFVASLKNIQLSLGQAFLPIYNAVLPALTSMANALGKVINYIAQFVTALFGAPKAAQNQATAIKTQVGGMKDLGKATTGAGKAAKKAAKDAKSLAAFDEINKLADKANTSSGSSGGVGGGVGAIGVPTMDSGGLATSMVEVSEKMKKFVDDLKTTLGELRDFMADNKTSIISTLAGIGAGIVTYLIGTHWTTIVTTVKTAMGIVGQAISAISWPIIGVAAIIGLFVAAVVDLWQTNEEFRTNIINAWNGIKDTLQKIWDGILKPILKAFGDMLINVWNNGLKPLWGKWKEFVKQIALLMTNLWKDVKPIVDLLIKYLGPIIVETFKATFKIIGDTINAILGILGHLLDGASVVINGVSKIFSGLITFLTGVFTGDWKKVFDGIGQIFKGFGTIIEGVLKFLNNVFWTFINWLNSTFFSKWNLQWVDAGKVFDTLKTGAKNAINAIIGFFKNIKLPEIKIPKIKLPHFSIIGKFSLSPLQVPKLGVKWYDKGGIFTSPSIIGVGEKRPEFVGALDDLRDIVRDEMQNVTGGGNGNLELTIQLGSLKIFHEIINGINQTQRQAGKTLINV